MDPNDTAGWNDENTVLSTFGVTTGGGIIPAEKKGEELVLLYDDPQYKAAYQWMNKMYRSNLVDPEVVTDKKERYKEKNKAGRVAMNVGSFFNVDSTIWETLDGPTEPGWFYQVVPFPKVEGVEKLGANTVINPYPGYDVYISKDSKNVEAILKFLDYTLQPKAEQQHVVNEGPVGKFWGWVDQPLGTWKFIGEAYDKARNSGEPAQKATVTPELYMLSSYNNDWYPWWNTLNEKAGGKKTSEFTAAVGQMGAVRSTQPHDLVKAKAGGLLEKYLPELENIRKEYRAKFIMSTSDEQFEANWKAFRDALEKRAHWSEVKQEWQEQYDALIKEQG
jgi:ABC-type glycerol-3-phosphate transport system substrate-binding protein